MAGMLTPKGAASSVTEALPATRRARIAWRVGSAKAAKVVLRWPAGPQSHLDRCGSPVAYPKRAGAARPKARQHSKARP